MSNFITKIKIPKILGDEAIIPAYPVSDNDHVINILCGLNNSGKSYIFRAIVALMSQRKINDNYQGYELVYQDPDHPPRFYPATRISRFKEPAGIISIKHSKIDPNLQNDFRNFSLQFFFDQIVANKDLSELLIEWLPIDKGKWCDDHDYRNQILKVFPVSEETIYLCDRTNAVVAFIEDSLKAKLAFRKLKTDIEITAINTSGVIVPYPLWSDGQKTLFYLALCIAYWQPEVLLIDELENHLHPQYMSRILQHIRNNVPQTFIATHHPHIIFSNYADKVFYIEVVDKNESIDFGMVDQKINKYRHPSRKVLTLENSFNKLAAAYQLFDTQDYQLLKQANMISSYCDIIFYKELLKIFFDDVVPPSDKSLPDRQSLDIASLLQSEHKQNQLTILDYGAGLGRVISELKKLSEWQLKKLLRWYCWEPDEERRKKLYGLFGQIKERVTVVDTLDDIKDSNNDIVVITNVLHELTPCEAAKVIEVSVRKLKKENGTILISEIYPLLHAEKQAVPYPEEFLRTILRKIGFICTSRNFPVFDHTAYCISARPNKDGIGTREKIQQTIEATWDEIQQNTLSSYMARIGASDHSDFRSIIQDLTTIASIEAWRQGFWK
jgi:energy-coupling factor transporter ATP-binding protein EcfA2